MEVPNKGRTLAKLPHSLWGSGRASGADADGDFNGRSPRALRHEALLFPGSARPATLPGPPRLVGRTVGCSSGRRMEPTGSSPLLTPKMLLGLVLQRTSITCLSKRGLCQPTDS